MVDGEVLRGEHTIQAFKRKGALFIEKVGDMGLLEAGLLSQLCSGQNTQLNAANDFEAKKFVEMLKVHRRKPDGTISFGNEYIEKNNAPEGWLLEFRALANLCAILFFLVDRVIVKSYNDKTSQIGNMVWAESDSAPTDPTPGMEDQNGPKAVAWIILP